ncbi:hypothetical protein Tco_0236568 [Tanacetum coccineum]
MKRKLEEMESENHGNWKIVKDYCEEKKKKEEDKNNKKKKIVRLKGYNNRNRGRGGMQVGHDSNGKLILIGKSYAEFYMEKEEKKKKKKREEGECDSEPISPPREPRWSDENLAMHIWRGVCRSKGVKCHEYVLRTDYRNMTREEIKLDLLWTKVYQAEAEEEAPEEAAVPKTTNS